MSYFVNYRWPGNIRELENLLERIVLLSRSDDVTLANLPENLRTQSGVVERTVEAEAPGNSMQTEGLSLEAVEREMIVQALRKFDWNQTQAARHLAISRKTLMYRIAKYGIEKEVAQSRPRDLKAGAAS